MVIGREGSEEGQFHLYILFFPFLQHRGVLVFYSCILWPGLPSLHHIHHIVPYIFIITIIIIFWRNCTRAGVEISACIYIFFFPFICSFPLSSYRFRFSFFIFFSAFVQSDGDKIR